MKFTRAKRVDGQVVLCETRKKGVSMVLFPNHYTLISFVQSNDLQHEWRNSIDVVAAPGSPPAPSDPIVRAWVSFIAGMSRSDSTVVRTQLRPWSRGKNVFGTGQTIWDNPENTVGDAYGAGGVFISGGDGNTVTGEICAKLVKTNFASGGKVGHLYIRNLPNEANVKASAGGPAVWDLAAFGTNPNTAINSYALSKLGAYLQDNPLPRFCNVHYSAKTNTGPFESAIGKIVSEDLTSNNLRRSSKK